MKILVVIANYGQKNDRYLDCVLSEYRRMSYRIDIVVLSNLVKNLGPEVEVIPGLPSKNSHSLPFGHKKLFASRKDAYDLFIYTEDDILITQRNIDAFLRATNILPPQEVAGFFRWEQRPDGTKFYPDAHLYFRWLPGSVKVIDGHTFAHFTNDHSGCFALTRGQLAEAIRSGGFLVPPHEHKYSLLETAATDPYTQCGFRKVICVSHFEDFLVHHLPNKYVGSQLGVDDRVFRKQIDALLTPRKNGHVGGSLLEPETKVFRCEWSKDYYEVCRHDLIALLPTNTRSVLSIGCGWGETEEALLKKGIDVTAIPLDSVVSACAESRGVKVVCANLEGAIAQLYPRRFDGMLMPGVLHLFRDPSKTLRQAGSLLNERGVLVATLPNFQRLPFLWFCLRRPSDCRGWRDFRQSGVHPLSRREVKALLRNNGFSPEEVSGTTPKRWKTLVALTGRLGEGLFASEYIFVARPTANPESAAASSASIKSAEGEHEAAVAFGRDSN